MQCEYNWRKLPNDNMMRVRYFEDCMNMKEKFQ